MNSLSLGLSTSQAPGPTLRAVRRLTNISAALHEISRRPVGIDEIPYEAFLDPIGHMRWNPNLLDAYPDLNPLKTIQESLVHPYTPDASEAIRVKGRDLERGTVANRLVERAITKKLNANLDRYLNSRSFGYRPGRSAEMAILQVRQAVRRGLHWALKTDIKDFFQSIDRRILENQLSEPLQDEGLRNTVMAVVSPLVVANGRTLQRDNGLPGGNGLSPVLSNLYLHRIDECCSTFEYFRYADDMLVLGTSWDAVSTARKVIRVTLESIGLQLNHSKTFIRDLHRQSVVFLGYELRGGNLYPPEENIRRFQTKLELRGLRDRKKLMKDFVHRYRIGPVRKLFRRLDRQLGHLYLRKFFHFAYESKWIDENPARQLEGPKVQQSPTMPFTPDQMAEILSACEKYGKKARSGRYSGPENARRIRAFVLLLRHSGLRIGDAVTLERRRTIADKLLLYTAKTGTPVYLPLPTFVLSALEVMPRISGTYFFWTGESEIGSATGDWQRTLKAVFKEAGIPDGHAHRFRDTLAVELLQAGVPMDRVSMVLGHSSIRVTEKHYSPWVRARQEQLEADVRRTWGVATSARNGTSDAEEKQDAVN